MQTFNAATAARFPVAVALRADASRNAQEAGGTCRRFRAGEEIFSEGDCCDVFYKVVSGTVRTGKLLPDGRRQIDGFQLAGDLFGLESGDCHRFTAEAVDAVEVMVYRRGTLSGLVQANPAFGERLMASMLTSLDRAHHHAVLLGRKTAVEKMASFLLDLARRTSRTDRVDLPMQRMDIADYLGLTIETVSRTLSQMVRAGLIRLSEAGRTVTLANAAGLELLGA
jgi:CRP/FNR family nitrogen fixation transcriptional regulator